MPLPLIILGAAAAGSGVSAGVIATAVTGGVSAVAAGSWALFRWFKPEENKVHPWLQSRDKL